MLISNPDMKDKYPYWWSNKMKDETQKQYDEMLSMAEYQISKYIELKMKELDSKLSQIENALRQLNINIEANVNGKPMTSDVINRELKRMVIEQFENILK